MANEILDNPVYTFYPEFSNYGMVIPDDPETEENETYTFYPQFSEFVTLYRGISSVRIGEEGTTDETGWLYATYVSGEDTLVGPVTSYAEAVEMGYQGTKTQWLEHIAEVSQRAEDAEAWAAGTRQGIAVSSTHTKTTIDGSVTEADPTYQNSSKYWAEERSKKWAIGNDADSAPTADNNSRELARRAGVSETNAKNWAVGPSAPSSSTGGTDSNNAKYWAGQSEAWAEEAEDEQNSKLPVGSESAKTHANHAAASETASKNWAVGPLDETTSGTSVNNSKYYSIESESWAKGTRSGTAVSSGDPAYHNNSKYWSDQASASAASARDWAVKDTAVEGNLKSAKAYATDAGNSATAAATSEANAAQWATGNSQATYSSGSSALDQANRAAMLANGNSSSTGSATDNALYYKDVAKAWAEEPENEQNSKLPSGSESAKTHATHAAASATDAQGWAVMSTNSGSYSDTNNSEYWAGRSKLWAVKSTNSSAPSDTNNSEYWAQQSSIWATSTTEIGTTGYKGAKGYAEDASASATSAAQSASDASDSACSASGSASDASDYATAASGSATAAEGYKNAMEQELRDFNNTVESVVITYKNNQSGTNPDAGSGSWTANPSPSPGYYTWSKTVFTWKNALDPQEPNKKTTTIYNVSYTGIDGAVLSVNALTGNVVVDGSNIYVDSTAAEPVTISAQLTELGTAITNAQIDALFE